MNNFAADRRANIDMLTEEIPSVVMSALVDGLDRQRPFLHRASVLPQRFAGCRFQNRDTVRQGRSVNSVAWGGPSETHLPFSLAADFVSEEGTRFQQVVAYMSI